MATPTYDLIDLVCHRYPGTKPSEYLDIEDRWTAFQIDSALAFRGNRQDELKNRYYLNLINWHILQVCKSMGAKGISSKPPQLETLGDTIKEKDDLMPLDQVLAQLGGAGTVVTYQKR